MIKYLVLAAVVIGVAFYGIAFSTGPYGIDIPASGVETDTGNFDGVLSGADTTVQAALETLDEGGTTPANDSVTMDKLDDDGDFTALTGAWRTSGTIRAKTYTATDADGDYDVTAATGLLDNGLLYVGSESGGASRRIQLDPVEDGMFFCVVATGATGSASMLVAPDASDIMAIDGVDQTTGNYVFNDSDTRHDMMCFRGISSTTWIVYVYGSATVDVEP